MNLRSNNQLSYWFFVVALIVFFSISNTYGVTVRDNELKFTTGINNYSITKVTYKIGSSAVYTKNGQSQDKDKNLSKGNEISSGWNNNTLNFRVGRKGSKDVAKYWKNSVGKKSTYGKHPDRLNFAILGTLTLTLENKNDREDKIPPLKFKNIALAQGSSNDWWFGGYKCWNKDKNKVWCPGEMGSTKINIEFQRGGNANNEIKFSSKHMVYRSNSVEIGSNDGLVKSVSFAVKASKASYGEDPLKRLGEVKTKDNRFLIFNAGRKAKNETAGWWKNRFPKTQTTFNSTPNKLHFSAIGDLTLNLYSQGKYTIPNIGIAQGRSSGMNNWWFGGQQCSYIGSYQVACYGYPTDIKNSLRFVFERGGNSVNKINLLSVDNIDFSEASCNKPSGLSHDELRRRLDDNTPTTYIERMAILLGNGSNTGWTFHIEADEYGFGEEYRQNDRSYRDFLTRIRERDVSLERNVNLGENAIGDLMWVGISPPGQEGILWAGIDTVDLYLWQLRVRSHTIRLDSHQYTNSNEGTVSASDVLNAYNGLVGTIGREGRANEVRTVRNQGRFLPLITFLLSEAVRSEPVATLATSMLGTSNGASFDRNVIVNDIFRDYSSMIANQEYAVPQETSVTWDTFLDYLQTGNLMPQTILSLIMLARCQPN